MLRLCCLSISGFNNIALLFYDYMKISIKFPTLHNLKSPEIEKRVENKIVNFPASLLAMKNSFLFPFVSGKANHDD